jgi:tetratricopeptide (TPR) repeat protein
LIFLGKYPEALEACSHAKACDPSWIKAYIREGQAYFEMKEFGESAASYFEALKLEPTNEELRSLFNISVERGKEAHQYGK